MFKDEFDLSIKCLLEKAMSFRDIVKKMKNLGISVSQSTRARIIGNKTKNGKQNVKGRKILFLKELKKFYPKKKLKK